ncbi:MAG: C39 family peptidase [Patescibacteria group bacterium]
MTNNKTNLITLLFAVIVTISALFFIDSRYKVIIVNAPKITHTPAPVVKTDRSSSSTTPTSSEPKANLLLPVPFTPQAPTGNWDKLHNEACEEASAIMAAVYFGTASPSSPGSSATSSGSSDEGKMPAGQERLVKLPADFVEQEITKLTTWEMQTFGYNLDITSEEVVKMIIANYGLQAKIITDVTEDNIKKELAQNHLVLLPANGQLLGNPNYKQPGPKYHMLVIRGYTPTSIITNDPGTRNGLNYAYDFDTLYNANGNWDHETEKVDLNIKNIIIIWK